MGMKKEKKERRKTRKKKKGLIPFLKFKRQQKLVLWEGAKMCLPFRWFCSGNGLAAFKRGR